jgi:hypothetical protein
MRQVAFFAILAAQVVIPAWQLAFAVRPARFGWQMYAGSRLPSRIVVSAGGAEREVLASDYLGNLRLDLDTEERLPPTICRRERAVRVVYHFPDREPREFPCPQPPSLP